jgi:CheY-like chemotaxis protein
MVYNSSTILIVDDDEAICELITENLTEDGYTCDIASTAYEALNKLQNHCFDIALLDIKLPDKSGMELLQTVRVLYQNTKIIMMTAVNDLDNAIQAMKLGASDYVVKPFTIDKLNASIGTVLKSNKIYSSVSSTTQLTGNISNDTKTVNQSLSAINAIAYGVDAQVDYFDFHSKIVTDRTIELARFLGLSEMEIEKWTVARNELYYERGKRIRSTLDKIERNLMIQIILGLTPSLYRYSYSTYEQNLGGTSDGTHDS